MVGNIKCLKEVAVKDKKIKKKTDLTAKKTDTVKKGAKTARGKARISAKKAKAKTRKTVKAEQKEQNINLRAPHKGTFNTHDLMHAPVEKTIKMLEKIIAGERLFTM